jgi:hypothetical protein
MDYKKSIQSRMSGMKTNRMSALQYRKHFKRSSRSKPKEEKMTATEFNLGQRLEFHECVDLVKYLEDLKLLGKVLVYSHTPNETYTPYHNQKTKNRMMGVRAGLPDYVVVTKTDVLFIEMKRASGKNKATLDQKIWLQALADKPVYSKVCYGFDEAKQFIDFSLENPILKSIL